MDDSLVFDGQLGDHVSRVCEALTCARDNGITLSAKKFVFAASEIEFCGYHINADGWTMDDTKVSAIRNFSIPAIAQIYALLWAS